MDVADPFEAPEADLFSPDPVPADAPRRASTRGRRGGLRLARPASEIRIGDIVRLTEETHIQAVCFGQLQESCAILPAAPINRIFGSAVEAFIEVLDQHNLQELVSARPLGRLGRASAAFLAPTSGQRQFAADTGRD